MPHPKGRKQLTRMRILDAAARLFAARGFDATSIEAVMLECGLTRGGFYAHFRSKAHLYQESLGVVGSIAPAARSNNTEWLSSLFDACGSGVGSSAWAFLASDVANASPGVRSRYLRAIEAMRDKLASAAQPLSTNTQDRALAAVAMLIGALAVSATVDESPLKCSLIDACRRAVRHLCEDDQPAFFWAIDAAVAGLPRH